MTEKYTQRIKKLPSIEVARNVARLKRANFALKENGSVGLGGWEDDGMIMYRMAEDVDPDQWQNDTDYEKVVIYQLKREITEDKVKDALQPPEIDQDSTMSLALRLGHEALIDGLLRLEVLEERRQRLSVPLGVRAAFHYMRGDINDSVGRELYSREPSVETHIKRINAKSRYRKLRYTLPVEPGGDMDMTSSVYSVVDVEPELSILKHLDLDPSSPAPPWWQELRRDFSRIDDAAMG